jgi:cell division protein FtsL
MNEITTLITHNPLYGVIAGLLALFVVFSLVKKLIKWALIACVMFAAYVYYMHTQGKDVKLPSMSDAEKVLEQGKQAASKLGDQAKDAKDQAGKVMDKAKQVDKAMSSPDKH